MINGTDLTQTGQRRHWAMPAIEAITTMLVNGIGALAQRLRYAVKPLGTALPRAERARTSSSVGNKHRDRLRQVLNLVFAIGQVATTYVTVTTGADEQFSSRGSIDPPIIPAEYTFIGIWTIIYASTIAYAIYQALPGQRENELLRRIGFWTAAAFAGTSLWLIAAGQNQVWLTVAIFFGILAALLVAFVQLIRPDRALSYAERYLVVAPISIYSAWATIGTIANTAAALNESGVTNVVVAPQSWAIIMLVIAGTIAAFVATVSRGNLWYVLTILWALLGIVVANLELFPSVAIAAGAVGRALVAAETPARGPR
jgi:translocator protein